MKFKGFHHIGLYCADAEKSLAFYTALGGVEVSNFPMRGSGKIIYLVDMGGNAVVELIPREFEGEETNTRWAHICLLIEDVQAAHDLALKLGARSRIEPRVSIIGGGPHTHSFVFGPDDEVIEFFEYK
jgi:lactoylglutathione lyase